MIVLGYTKLTWDNDSGSEQKPWSFIKLWSSLTKTEKDAAKVLGMTKKSWEKKRKTGIFAKKWDDMTSCSDGKDPPELKRSLRPAIPTSSHLSFAFDFAQQHCLPYSTSSMLVSILRILGYILCQDANASFLCADSIKPEPEPIVEPPPLGARANAAEMNQNILHDRDFSRHHYSILNKLLSQSLPLSPCPNKYDSDSFASSMLLLTLNSHHISMQKRTGSH